MSDAVSDSKGGRRREAGIVYVIPIVLGITTVLMYSSWRQTMTIDVAVIGMLSASVIILNILVLFAYVSGGGRRSSHILGGVVQESIRKKMFDVNLHGTQIVTIDGVQFEVKPLKVKEESGRPDLKEGGSSGAETYPRKLTTMERG